MKLAKRLFAGALVLGFILANGQAMAGKGHGPGDCTTGNGGVGPKDGSGYGSKSGRR